MYQILIIFSFFSFNDISWGTRGGGEQEKAKDPLDEMFQNWLTQPGLNWLFKCWVKQPKPRPGTERAPLLQDEKEITKKKQEEMKKEEEAADKLQKEINRREKELQEYNEFKKKKD